MSGPDVVAIGGGHGLAMSLRAIGGYAGRVTAVVATSDDGGSSGRLRDTLDMPAPGDLRRCLTALAPDRALAETLEHRFGAGELAGHAVGNLVLAGLVDAGTELLEAADRLSRWLGIDPDRARVVPATRGPVCVIGTTADGEVRGQVSVEGTEGVVQVSTDPPDPEVPEEAREAIAAADQIVIGPGSIFGSVLSVAVIPDVRAAVQESDATSVFVCNLRADERGAAGFDVARHVDLLADHGVRVDVVVAQDGALPVGDLSGVKLVTADIDRPHGLAHDADLLGSVLADLR